MDAQFLRGAYSRNDLTRFLGDFLPDDFIPEAKSLNPSERYTPKFITTVTRLGKCPSLELEVFEVHHSSLHDARVGISRDAFQLLQHYSMCNRALMAFVPESGEQWRFSLLEMTAEVNDATLRINRSYSNPRRFSFLLGTEAKTKTPEQYLVGKGKIRTRTENSKSLSPWEDLKSRFSVEVLSDEFFEKYREHYANLVQFVTGKRFVKTENKWVEKCLSEPNEMLMQNFNRDEKKVRDYVKKMMGRITFLHFLQRKGWMKGDSNYMQNLFIQSKQQDNYLEVVLEPLFFGILNTKPQERETLFATKGWDKSLLNEWKDIPYLNGGLFECDENDLLKCIFPSNYFSNLFTFFTEYNFTIDENDPNDAEIGVDPEMLGKIFENLLEDNKDKGAFYTPKEIVQYMCQEALINYLEPETSLSKATIRLFVKSPDDSVKNIPKIEQEKLRKSLESVKICDPAIGSGAFPMELLNELLHCREALMDAPYNRAEIKKSIIQNNIYGVDIEQGAIDIARLRFWLSIVVDEDTPSPLPNLDYKIMNGNSLLTTFNGKYLNINDNQKHANIQAIIAKKKSLQQNQKEYFLLNGQAKYEKEIVIKNLILDIIDLQLGYERNSFAIKQIQTGNLFGEDKPKQMSFAEIAKQKAPEKQATIDYCKVLRETLNDTTKSIEERARTKIPFFDWQIMFADVFNRPSKQGFDIVIGNPPYVQVKKGLVPKNMFPFSEGKDNGKQNLYKLFVELSYNLARPNAIVSLITQSSLMCDASAQYTRELLLRQTEIQQIIEFPKIAPHPQGQLFKSALVATCIVIYKKCTPSEQHTFYISANNDLTTLYHFDFAVMNQSIPLLFYPNGYCFPLIRAKDFSIVKKMNQNTVFLQTLAESTSQGDFNLTTEKSCFSTEPTDVKMYRGCHIHRYQIDDIVEEYIHNNYKASIITSNQSKPYLVGQQISGMSDKHRFNFTINKNDKCLFGNSVNKVGLKQGINPKVILAILNSRAIDWYFRKTSTNNHVNIYELEQLPIPNANNEQQAKIVALVDMILAKKKQNPQADTSVEENAIDEIVYKLYNLTHAEIGIIKG